MKRLICIPILILLIAVVCITGMININQKTDAMLETLESTRLAMEQGSYEEANRLSQTLFSQWEASEKALVYFVNSDTLDQLGYAVAQIRNLTKESQKDEFLVAYSDCKLSMNKLQESEKISLEIFF